MEWVDLLRDLLLIAMGGEVIWSQHRHLLVLNGSESVLVGSMHSTSPPGGVASACIRQLTGHTAQNIIYSH